MCSYLEWQLNVDKDVLQDFTMRVQKDFSRLYPMLVIRSGRPGLRTTMAATLPTLVVGSVPRLWHPSRPPPRCRHVNIVATHPRSTQFHFSVARLNRRASHTQRRRARLPRRSCRQQARNSPPFTFAYEARTGVFCANDARPISCSRGGRCPRQYYPGCPWLEEVHRQFGDAFKITGRS